MVTWLSLASANLEVVAYDKSPNWWEVEIRVDGVSHTLGADAPSIVLTGLRKAVARGLPGPVAGTLGGLPVAWVVTLSEMHGSVYVSEAGAKRTVFFQDQHAQLIGTVTLTQSERAAWQQKLDAIPTSGVHGDDGRNGDRSMSPPQ